MFEQRGLAVQTGLNSLSNATELPALPFPISNGENDSSFQETNLMAEESLTNAVIKQL